MTVGKKDGLSSISIVSHLYRYINHVRNAGQTAKARHSDHPVGIRHHVGGAGRKSWTKGTLLDRRAHQTK